MLSAWGRVRSGAISPEQADDYIMGSGVNWGEGHSLKRLWLA